MDTRLKTGKKVEQAESRGRGRPKGWGSRQLVESLRRRILTLELPPGSGLDESALVSEYGISRTPVREALIRLAAEGFVTLNPNRGARVSVLRMDALPALLEAMELCLRATSRYAADRRTDKQIAAIREQHEAWKRAAEIEDHVGMSGANSNLHLEIARAGTNQYMIGLYEQLLPQYHRLSVTMLSSAHLWSKKQQDYFNEVADEHERLIAAIETGNVELADHIAKAHAKLIGTRLEAFIKSGYAHSLKL